MIPKITPTKIPLLMKNIFTYISLLLLALVLIHCEGTIIPYSDPCQGKRTTIPNISMPIEYLDSLGNNLLHSDTPNSPFDPNFFSLWATDENWNMLYNSKGLPIKDFPNGVAYQENRDSLNKIWGITLFLSHKYRKLPHDKVQSFFLFRINEYQVDTIIAYYNIHCKNFQMEQLYYKGHTLTQKLL